MTSVSCDVETTQQGVQVEGHVSVLNKQAFNIKVFPLCKKTFFKSGSLALNKNINQNYINVRYLSLKIYPLNNLDLFIHETGVTYILIKRFLSQPYYHII